MIIKHRHRAEIRFSPPWSTQPLHHHGNRWDEKRVPEGGFIAPWVSILNSPSMIRERMKKALEPIDRKGHGWSNLNMKVRLEGTALRKEHRSSILLRYWLAISQVYFFPWLCNSVSLWVEPGNKDLGLRKMFFWFFKNLRSECTTAWSTLLTALTG